MARTRTTAPGTAVVGQKVETDAYRRGGVSIRAERTFGKENPDAILRATNGQPLSKGVGLVSTLEDDFVVSVDEVIDKVDRAVRKSGSDAPATREQYLAAALGAPDANPPVPVDGRVKTAIKNLLTAKLAGKAVEEDGIVFFLRYDGTAETARVMHDVLYFGGELLRPQDQERFENTSCLIFFLGGKTATDPVELGAWLEAGDEQDEYGQVQQAAQQEVEQTSSGERVGIEQDGDEDDQEQPGTPSAVVANDQDEDHLPERNVVGG